MRVDLEVIFIEETGLAKRSFVTSVLGVTTY